MRSILKVFLLALAFLSVSSPAIAQYEYGSKVLPGENDESKALSPFYVGPEFAFIDLNDNGIFEPTDPVYININPADGVVSENDVRVTDFGSGPNLFPAGSQVRATDPDHDKPLIRFGTYRYPAAELRYFDMDGDKAYSIIDPVYLDLNPGILSAGDIRITGYPLDGPMISPPGSRVRDSDPDSDKPTSTLPGMLAFYNTNGDINNGAWGIYDTGDVIYIDTQYPFNTITVNDIRL